MLKRNSKISAEFSMSSMTDIIFLLLLFFMITSTVVQTNAIKVLLPQSSKQETQKTIVRLTIDASLNFYVGKGAEKDRMVAFEEIEPFLLATDSAEDEMYVALYADETVPYREIVRLLDVANRNKFKMVFATRPLEE
ncbi:MAG: biopolymer transporter ExbD [Paludibacteraceae bacterium]|jgi:biopolymer transport protein ExbD|nr:biopolymer transporter ExbD [Paludibacteraceae bacterium]MBR6310969.1 biopolymer transporter ExbD [Paludibacteraceae bacterium]MDD6357082.1 biopolymer transporter ExbD [Bacteroidales bacterium]